MALSFPSPSRSYDDLMHGVHFWGYDQKFWITFFIEGGALLKLNANTKAHEVGYLKTFGTHLNRIRIVAAKIYSHRRKASNIASFVVSVSDP